MIYSNTPSGGKRSSLLWRDGGPMDFLIPVSQTKMYKWATEYSSNPHEKRHKKVRTEGTDLEKFFETYKSSDKFHRNENETQNEIHFWFWFQLSLFVFGGEVGNRIFFKPNTKKISKIFQ